MENSNNTLSSTEAEVVLLSMELGKILSDEGIDLTKELDFDKIQSEKAKKIIERLAKIKQNN